VTPEGYRNLTVTGFFVLLTIINLSVAAISCQPSAENRFPSPAASPTPEAAQTRMVEEIMEKVETEEGVEIRRTVREYLVTPFPPLEEAVKIQKVETDDQIEVVGIDLGYGPGSIQFFKPGSTPPPPHMSFNVWVTSRNNGPARTLRTRITIEDPLTGEKHTAELDDFIGSGGTVRPGLGFHVEPKRWVAYVEVRVVPQEPGTLNDGNH
jgi:hypothetical protein